MPKLFYEFFINILLLWNFIDIMGGDEGPTVDASTENADPLLWTWFVVAVMAAVTMLCIIFFSVWVYNYR